MRKFIAILCFMSCLSLSCKADDIIPVPHDVATIEALISMHKSLMELYKSGENKEEIATASQFSVKEMAKKYNNVASNIQLRLKQGYAYLQYAYMLVKMIELSVNIIDEYTDFTQNIFSKVSSNPWVLVLYTDVTLTCEKKVKKIYNLIELNTAAQANLLKLDDERRMHFMLALETELYSLKSYISYQAFHMQMYKQGYLRYADIWDIMNSETLDRIAAEVIASM